mgnify:CR=1 FL=1
MPILTILGLIVAAIKIARELSAWLKEHPEITTAVRTRLEEIHEQVGQVESSVSDLRDAHARVESP